MKGVWKHDILFIQIIRSSIIRVFVVEALMIQRGRLTPIGKPRSLTREYGAVVIGQHPYGIDQNAQRTDSTYIKRAEARQRYEGSQRNLESEA
jgi:hypothetical protein